MASQLQLRRGTDTEHGSFTGAEAEITVNTTNKSAHVHDGITAGGIELARADLNNVDDATFLAKAVAAGVETSGGSATATVANITNANPAVVTTSSAHNFAENAQVTFVSVVGMTEVNGAAFYIDVLTGTSFALYTDVTLSTTYNSIANNAYISGGSVTASAPVSAPSTAAYVTVGNNATLPNERALSEGAGITITDGGAGGGVSIAAKLSATVPSNLGSAATGVSTNIARADHVHAMPTAGDVGAVPTTRTVSAGTGLSGGGELSSNITLALDADIGDLGNVTITSAANGDILIYNSATSAWENSTALARLTVESAGSTVGTELAITTVNFTGTAVSDGAVVVSAEAGNNSQVNVSIPRIYTEEQIQDIVGAMVSSNTENGVTVTYDDANGKLNFENDSFDLSLTGDVQGTVTIDHTGNVSMSTTISANSVALGTDTTGNYVSTLAAGTGLNIANSAGSAEGAQYTVSLDLDGNTSLAEFVADTVGSMVSSNTESGISVTYQDIDNTLDFDVADFTITLTGDVTGTGTVTNLGNVSFATQVANDSIALGTKTTGNYVATLTAGSGIAVTNGAAGLEGSAYTIALDLGGASGLDEFIADTVGAMVTSNTESGITVTYQDADNTLDFDVADFTITLAGDLSGNVTVTNLGNATLTAQIAADAVELGTNTTGNYVKSIANGSYLTGASASEGAELTLAVDATSANTASKVVARDGSGNFSAGTITANLTGTASLVNCTANNTANESVYVAFVDGATGSQGIETDTNLVYNPSTNTLTATTFSGTTTLVNCTANNTANETVYLTFVDGATGSQELETDTGLSYNPNTGSLTAVEFAGTATSAEYADLAERYLADDDYQAGTVIAVGGEAEVTAAHAGIAHSVLGVVSENPAYLMNNTLENGLAIALKGRVKVLVLGVVNKGDRLVPSTSAGYAVTNNDRNAWSFAIALESSVDGIVEAVIL
jgi:hypothetical protein